MLATCQIVTTVLLTLHRTDISFVQSTEEKIDNVLTHYKIAVYPYTPEVYYIKVGHVGDSIHMGLLT